MKLSEIILKLIKIPIDFIAGVLAFLFAYNLRTNPNLIPNITLPLDISVFPSINDYMIFSSIMIITLLLLLTFNKSYSLKHQPKLSAEIGKILIITIIWIMGTITYFYIIHEFPFSRLVLGYAWILTALLISASRILIYITQKLLLKNNIGKKNLIFIGSNKITDKLEQSLRKNPKYKIIGVIDDKQTNSKTPSNTEIIQELKNINKKEKIEEIIQTRSDLSDTQATDIRDFCRENQIIYRFVPDLLTIQQTNIEIETINAIPIISLKPTPLDGWGRVIKRGFDLFGATAGIIVLSPLMLISAIAIKIDSKGTILFKYLDDNSRVKRVGQKGKLFNFYKFRTMYPKTHNLRYNELANRDIRKGGPLVKIKNDPRVTKVGKFLRKTSIDELPQLFNVLIGNMSLVGPRPHLPEEVEKYKNHHKFVLTIKPGITGLAQISGRSDLNFEQENQLDTFYIENWSIWKDIIIILKTFGVLFKPYKE